MTPVDQAIDGDITEADLQQLRDGLRPLIGCSFRMLSLPLVALMSVEPSQVGSMVGNLMDAMIPHLGTTNELHDVDLTKYTGVTGDREGYPDYQHKSGFRLELKLLFVNNPALKTKRPLTPREPSARITQKVSLDDVDAKQDALLVIAYRLEIRDDMPGAVSPKIVDLDVFPMAAVVRARNDNLSRRGGIWFGKDKTPAVISLIGRKKMAEGKELDNTSYGRKSQERKDYNEDTNFGKLNRIPYAPLTSFLKKFGLNRDDELGADAESIAQTIEDTRELLEAARQTLEEITT